jgi:PAS domain S-box-containing protein
LGDAVERSGNASPAEKPAEKSRRKLNVSLALTISIIALSGITFVLDMMIPLGRVVWLLYMVPLYLSFWVLWSRNYWILPSVYTALIVFRFFFGALGVNPPVAVFNRILGIGIIWVTAVLMAVVKTSQETLRRRENESRTILENLPDVVTRLDRGLRYIYVNPKISTYGYRAGDMINKTDKELGIPDDIARLWDDHIRAAFETGKEDTIEFAYNNPLQHKKYYYSMRIVPEFSNGGINSVMAISRDITALKQTEEGLIKAREVAEKRAREAEEGRLILAAIMDNIPEVLLIIDSGGTIRRVSGYIRELTGLGREQVEGMNIEEFDKRLFTLEEVKTEIEQPIAFPVTRSLKQGEIILNEERLIKTVKGAVRTILVNSRPI